MILKPTDFLSSQRIAINPRRLEEGFFVEFNYKKRDGSSSQYDAIVLDTYPPGGYVWALKLNDMKRTDFIRVIEKFEISIQEEKGQEFQRLDVPEKGKLSYKMIQQLRVVEYYRKFIMTEMSLCRIRPIDFESLI